MNISEPRSRKKPAGRPPAMPPDVEVALVAFLTAMNGGSPETGEALGEVTA